MRLVRRTLTFTALAAGLGALVTGCTSSARVQQAEAAFPPMGAFVNVTGGRVHYVQKGSGPHVVLIHGAGGNLRDMTFDMMDRLTDDYTVTAFDRPGLGYTDRVPGVATGVFATEGDSPQMQAVMLREAAAELGITDPVVVGHSFGGIVSMAWAVAGLDTDAPENAKAVVSLAGVLMPWPGDLGAFYTVGGSAIGGAVVVPLVSAFTPEARLNSAMDGVFAPQPVPAGYIDYFGVDLAIRPETFRANARQVNTSRPFVVELSQRYPELTLPIEVVHGTADTTVPIDVHPEQMGPIVPSMTLTRLEGVGHMPHHADPQATVDAINRAASRAGLR